MNDIAGRLADGLEERHERSFAVGAGHMHHAGQGFFGIAERREQARDTPKGKINDSGVQPSQPLDNRVTLQRGALRSGVPARFAACRPRYRRLAGAAEQWIPDDGSSTNR